MTDDIDRAQALEQQLRQDALDRHRALHAPAPADQTPVEARSCAACGDPIPLRRLVAQPDATRCRFCQELVEDAEETGA